MAKLSPSQKPENTKLFIDAVREAPSITPSFQFWHIEPFSSNSIKDLRVVFFFEACNFQAVRPIRLPPNFERVFTRGVFFLFVFSKTDLQRTFCFQANRHSAPKIGSRGVRKRLDDFCLGIVEGISTEKNEGFSRSRNGLITRKPRAACQTALVHGISAMKSGREPLAQS